MSDYLLQSDEESNDYEEYFDSILANSDLALPNNWKEAEELNFAIDHYRKSVKQS